MLPTCVLIDCNLYFDIMSPILCLLTAATVLTEILSQFSNFSTPLRRWSINRSLDSYFLTVLHTCCSYLRLDMNLAKLSFKFASIKIGNDSYLQRIFTKNIDLTHSTGVVLGRQNTSSVQGPSKYGRR